MWLKFLKNFDFSPAALNGMSTTAYKAGTTENVTRECAELAMAAGAAEETTSPVKAEAKAEEKAAAAVKTDGEAPRRG